MIVKFRICFNVADIFMANIIACLALSLYVNIKPHQDMIDFLELNMTDQTPPMSYRGIILGMAVANFLLCFVAEV